jgi:hypothetical protein
MLHLGYCSRLGARILTAASGHGAVTLSPQKFPNRPLLHCGLTHEQCRQHSVAVTTAVSANASLGSKTHVCSSRTRGRQMYREGGLRDTQIVGGMGPLINLRRK